MQIPALERKNSALLKIRALEGTDFEGTDFEAQNPCPRGQNFSLQEKKFSSSRARIYGYFDGPRAWRPGVEAARAGAAACQAAEGCGLPQAKLWEKGAGFIPI